MPAPPHTHDVFHNGDAKMVMTMTIILLITLKCIWSLRRFVKVMMMMMLMDDG